MATHSSILPRTEEPSRPQSSDLAHTHARVLELAPCAAVLILEGRGSQGWGRSTYGQEATVWEKAHSRVRFALYDQWESPSMSVTYIYACLY